MIQEKYLGIETVSTKLIDRWDLGFEESALIIDPTFVRRPINPAIGSLRFNTDTHRMDYFTGIKWITV